MYKLLIKKISEKVDLTEQEEETIKAFFTPKKIKKRQYLLQQGDMCNVYTFVAKGSLATYSTDERGNEHVLSFSFEGSWVCNLASLLNEESSLLNIEALEACELLQLRADQQESLFAKVPAYERFVRIIYEEACITHQKRLESSLGLSAEEKYCRLLMQYPVITNTMPLTLIASYLGITPETLSRVRKHSKFYSLYNYVQA